MKVNLLIDNRAGVRNGYTNIDPYADPIDPAGRVTGDLSNLSHVVDDGEAAEIVALDIISYYPSRLTPLLLKNWSSKLAFNGTLTISVLDQSEIARQIRSGALDSNAACDVLHGTQQRDWQNIKSSFTMQSIISLIEATGLVITKKRPVGHKLFISAVRPVPAS